MFSGRGTNRRQKMSGQPTTDVNMQIGEVAMLLILGIGLPTADVASDLRLTMQLFTGKNYTANICADNTTSPCEYGEKGEYLKLLILADTKVEH
jgi:hypothetical protein